MYNAERSSVGTVVTFRFLQVSIFETVSKLKRQGYSSYSKDNLFNELECQTFTRKNLAVS